MSGSLIPESARWLALQGRLDAQKTRKRRLLPCNQKDISNDTDSIKMITEELRCAGYGSGHSSESKITRNQQIVNNDIIQSEICNTPIDRDVVDCANTWIQLPASQGIACKGIMKQEVVKDKLQDCSGWCDEDVSHDGGVIRTNMAKKCESTEHRTMTEPKILGSVTKRTGFKELFRTGVLRKYNLVMVFVW
jgi:hypothetical protein